MQQFPVYAVALGRRRPKQTVAAGKVAGISQVEPYFFQRPLLQMMGTALVGGHFGVIQQVLQGVEVAENPGWFFP
jgi:hypothetical protein